MCIFMVPLFDKNQAVFAVFSLCGAMIFAGNENRTFCFSAVLRCSTPAVPDVSLLKRGTFEDNRDTVNFPRLARASHYIGQTGGGGGI